MHDIRTSTITIPVSDGTTMTGHLAVPAGPGPHPALLIIQEIFGVNAHVRDVTERYARAGYVALAPDLFHRFAPGYDGSYEDIPASIAMTSNLTPAGIIADLGAAYGHLADHPDVRRDRIGAVGYCMGGRLAFVANAHLPLAAAVCFYGGGIAQNHLDLAARQHGPTLLVWAGNDPWIAPADRDRVNVAMRESGRPFVTAEFAGANHGFFCDARSDFEPRAARQAWALTQAFLNEWLRAA